MKAEQQHKIDPQRADYTHFFSKYSVVASTEVGRKTGVRTGFILEKCKKVVNNFSLCKSKNVL
jgi:hypothetical protein